jgi:hypothetical protein
VAGLCRDIAVSETLITDSPRLVAWECRRGAVPLPATEADAEKLFRHISPSGLFITSLRSDSEDYDPMWRKALSERRSVSGFVPCREYTVPGMIGVLFRHPSQCPKPLTPQSRILPPSSHD